NASGRPDHNNGLITLVVRTLYNKPTRHQTGAVECLLHGADSPPIKAPDISQTASKVSQSQFCMPNDKSEVMRGRLDVAIEVRSMTESLFCAALIHRMNLTRH